MKKLLVVIGMIVASGLLYACGGSSSKSSGGGGATTTVAAPTVSATKVPITSTTEAAKTVAASKTLATSFASGSSFPSLGSLVSKTAADQVADGHRILATVRDVQQRVAGIVEKQKALGKRVEAGTSVQTISCTDGGTMTFDPNSSPFVITYAACKEYGEYQNGTITMPLELMGQTSGSGGALAVNLTTINYATGGYTTRTHESVMNMTMTVGSFNVATGSSSFSMNGYESNVDYQSNSSDKQSFSSFSLTMVESSSGAVASSDITMNGSVSMDTFKDTTFTTIDTASGMTFQNFSIIETFNASTSTSTLTINGIYAMKTIPTCMDGTFDISTQAPLTTTGIGATTGQITVNGVVMVFNADGTVTATIGGVPQVITSYANACMLSF